MLGAWAAGLGVTVPEGGNVLPALLGEYTPTWFAALVIAGAMAAMMSSSDSMLLSGSSYLTRDLYRPLTGRGDASDARLTAARHSSPASALSCSPPSRSSRASTRRGRWSRLATRPSAASHSLPFPSHSRCTGGNDAFAEYAGVVGSQVFYGRTSSPCLRRWRAVRSRRALPTAYLGWTPGIVGILAGSC